MNESEDSVKPLQFPLKIEWPSRKTFGLEEDDSDERPDSGVGESVRLLKSLFTHQSQTSHFRAIHLPWVSCVTQKVH